MNEARSYFSFVRRTFRFESAKLGLIPRNLDDRLVPRSPLFERVRASRGARWPASQPFRYTAGGYVPPLRLTAAEVGKFENCFRKDFPRSKSSDNFSSNCAPPLIAPSPNSFPGLYARASREEFRGTWSVGQAIDFIDKYPIYRREGRNERGEKSSRDHFTMICIDFRGRIISF